MASTAWGAGLVALLCQVVSLQAETITGYIYCDNYFEFYFNGQLVHTDPLTFTPHNAVRVSFEYDGSGPKVYAIMCQDYASDSGYEYTETSSPQLGDGSLLAEFSDGTTTSRDWKAYTVTFGPTDASVAGGCSSSNLDACSVQDNGVPTEWFSATFDDSTWVSATEYTAAEAGWGRAPSYRSGECGTITSPLTKQNANPSSIQTTADECLDPRSVLCGGDQSCSGDEGRMIWGSNLEKDNKMLFRYSASSSGSSSSSSSTSESPAATCGSADPGIAACTAAKPASQRVRRELGDLSQAEWQKVVDVIWTLKNTSMADGLSRYGSAFRTYDYFVAQHAVVVMDSRGDQGHFSAAFASWHAAFILEFELSMLAVNPDVGALPYWDATWNPLTEEYFGSPTGTGANNVVADGKFAHFPVVTNFDMRDYSAYMRTVAGASNGFSGNGGFLRGTNPNNPLQTSEVTRYGSAWTFSAAGQAECVTGSACWNDWYGCIEGGSSAGNFHSGAHVGVGGQSGSNRGDFEDPTTSPNDPIFWFHHANVDRNRLDWMEAHLGEASVYWGFERECFGPYKRNCPAEGISLGDVASAHWPFSRQQLNLSGNGTEDLTHADLLCLLGPETAPYSYAAPTGQTTSAPTSTSNVSPDTSGATVQTSTAGKILGSAALWALLCSWTT